VHAPGEAPIEVRLDEAGSDCGMCAIASIENANGEIRVTRQVRYFAGHKDMDQAYRWGLRWTKGSKD
jgi:tellurite resistance protein TerA